MVFFESPRRLAVTLAELAGAFGAGRRAAVCRELTKTHEEVRRGTLAELAEWARPGPLGEITLVVQGAPAGRSVGSPADAAAEVAVREQSGQPRNAAIVAVARERGLPRGDVYDAVVQARSAARGSQPRGPG